VNLVQYDEEERQLAVFSLGFRIGRKEIRDLPILTELERDELQVAARSLDSKYFDLAAREVKIAGERGVRVISSLSSDYPSSLLTIPGAPELLYATGNYDLLRDLKKLTCVGIVGSRRPSLDGRELAENLAHQIALNNGIVVSGLAYGCDAAAHRGALRAAKNSDSLSAGIAVLGSGVLNIYPADHKPLAQGILENRGLIISEFGVDQVPHRGCFPARNRIISGVSKAVVIVEAGEKSGSLITARFAAEQGRDLFVVPGSPRIATCIGSNELLKDGAYPITGFSDLRQYFGEAIEETPKRAEVKPTDPVLKLLYGNLPKTLEELCLELNKTPTELLPHLIKYEMSGVIVSENGRFAYV